MAQLDIKHCTFRLVDGRRATLDVLSGNAGITYQVVSKHRGTRQDLKIAYVVAGNNTPLSVAVATVSGITTITVNVATNGGGAATSTASQVKAAVDASMAASALVTDTLDGDGTGVVSAFAATAINTNPAHFVALKIGNGTVDFTQALDVQYTLDRGNLDTVKTGEDVPMEVSVDLTFEFFTGDKTDSNPSPVDALTQSGPASSWTSTDDDPLGCSPYSVDLEVEFNESCAAQLREFYVFQVFYWDDLNPTYKDGKITFKGKCNTIAPAIYRVL